MLKIRLRRMGAIRQPHYRIVVADARSPRDGRFIESLGHYNPLTDPATIQIDLAKYEDWKKKGAQPTDAVASLVKRFSRAERKAAETGEAQPASRQTRTASGKGATRAAAAEAVAEPEMQAEAAEEAPVAEVAADQPMSEVTAEASRDGGEESEALTGAAETSATVSETAEDAAAPNEEEA